jgi:HK97 family phage portal protein
VGLWSWFTGVTPNTTTDVPASVGLPGAVPGDPEGLVVEGEDTFLGERSAIIPSPWSGWPAEWAAPAWSEGRLGDLVDSAWAAIDLNSSVLSAMPVYRTRDGQVLEPTSWMTNPDPLIYTSWAEFAKQLFWDFQLGEAFVLPMARGADGWPVSFRVIPPWLVNVEMGGGRREYRLGNVDVTDDILHIRYKSSTDSARGVGPLESGKLRIIAAGVLARYATEIAQQGGIPHYVITSERRLSKGDADDLLDMWWRDRIQNPGKPALLTGGVTVNRMQFTPEELGMVDLAQFNEGRIVTLLGVPPFLLGLPSGGDPMTYSNVSSLFDFHDRASLRSKALHVMTALSGWALPRGQAVELNRDEYSRPGLNERAEAYTKLAAVGALSAEEIRTMERLVGPGPSLDVPDPEEQLAPAALTGGGRS